MSGNKKGFGLPFAPPLRAVFAVKYRFPKEGHLIFDIRVAGAQKDIVPPEKSTDAWFTLNLSAGKQFPLGKTLLKTGLQVGNLLNRRYYDHTSYYRLIGVPEPGIGASLILGLEF